MEIGWIKLSTDLFTNRKIRQILSMPDGDAVVMIWLQLLILAGCVNDRGLVYFTKDMPYTEEMLSVQFGRAPETVRLALKTFGAFGMTETTGDGLLRIANWEKYQNAEGLEKIREQTRERVAKYRKNLNSQKEELPVTLPVTQCNATEEDKEKEKDKDSSKEREVRERKPEDALVNPRKPQDGFRGNPPTQEEVKKYCLERGGKVDAERFFDYYSSNGWMVGKNPMKDWKAAVRSWETNGFAGAKSPPPRSSPPENETEFSCESGIEAYLRLL